MIQYCFDLLTFDAWKPLQKVVYRRPVLNVFKKGGDWDACAFKYPFTADNRRATFDNC